MPAPLAHGAIEAEALAKAAESDARGKYATEIDRESAREELAARMAAATGAQATGALPPVDDIGDLEVPLPPPPERGDPRRRRRRASESSGNAVVDYLPSGEGRQMVNTVARGVFFGLLRRRR